MTTSTLSTRCNVCRDAVATSECGSCGKRFYCGAVCQAADWNKLGHDEYCGAVPVRHAVDGTDDDDDDDDGLGQRVPLTVGIKFGDLSGERNYGPYETRNLTLQSIKSNVFEALADVSFVPDKNTGDARLFGQNKLSEFYIFWLVIQDTDFFAANRAKADNDNERELTVFAPTNEAMHEWFEDLNVDRHEFNAADTGDGGCSGFFSGGTGPLDVGATLKALKEHPEYRQLMIVLVSHFIEGIRPLESGREVGPDGKGLDVVSFNRKGIIPSLRTGRAFRQRNYIDPVKEVTDNMFYCLAFPDRDSDGDRVRRIVVERQAESRRADERAIEPTYFGYDVSLRNGGRPSRLFLDKEHTVRYQKGYIHAVEHVFALPSNWDRQFYDPITKEALAFTDEQLRI